MATPGPRALLSLADLEPGEIAELCEVAAQYGQAPDDFVGRLRGTRVGLVFTAPSTRTRVSFWSAATKLGCDVLHLGPADLQTTTGETWDDTGSVLATYLDTVVVRTNGPDEDVVALARHVPSTINALTHGEHPTQAIADHCALVDHFGTIEGLRLAYLGAVNNTARALALLVSQLPFGGLDVYSPDGAGFTPDETARLDAAGPGGYVRQHLGMPASPDPVDAVYTTRWHSMGEPRPEDDWRERFAPYAVTARVIERFSGPVPAVFLHDLPAVRGEEVASDVLDGDHTPSLAKRQVHHKASAAAAALIWTAGDR